MNSTGKQLGDATLVDFDYADVLLGLQSTCLHALRQKCKISATHTAATHRLFELMVLLSWLPSLLGETRCHKDWHSCYSHASSQRHLTSVDNQYHTAAKFRSYLCCILSILLYGRKTWSLTSTEWSKLDSFLIRCQQLRILNNALLDSERNTDVHEAFDQSQSHHNNRTSTPPETISHVARIPDSNPVKTSLSL